MGGTHTHIMQEAPNAKLLRQTGHWAAQLPVSVDIIMKARRRSAVQAQEG